MTIDSATMAGIDCLHRRASSIRYEFNLAVQVARHENRLLSCATSAIRTAVGLLESFRHEGVWPVPCLIRRHGQQSGEAPAQSRSGHSTSKRGVDRVDRSRAWQGGAR